MLEPIINLEIVNAFGEIANFTDITGSYAVNNTSGYGSPNLAYNQVGAVRLLIGNYINQIGQEPIGENASLLKYNQYIKTKGSAKTYDNKLIGVGNYIIPQIDGITIQAGDEFLATGYYNPLITPSRWLPTLLGTPLYLSPDELGFGSSGLIPDSIFTIKYQVFGTALTSQFNPIANTEYLVTSGIVAYKGSNYRQGESFIATDTTLVTLVSGAFGVAPYESGCASNFQTTYNLEQSLCELNTSLILNPKPQPKEVNYQIALIFANLDTIKNSAKIGLVSLSEAYDNLLYCTQVVENIQLNIY